MVNNLNNICNTGKNITNNIRLAKEISILSKSLPLNYESSIFVIVDEFNMQNIHALIIPSHGTPYSNGCFLFHIYLPETYPKNPPLVKLITTGNGTVRFNPNLYYCCRVCLSWLGTWGGNASESWFESTSIILQVLISSQALICIEPYVNEPSFVKQRKKY
ncbi:MAG: ubiquitin-conjugating enzyme E2 [Candidatus Fonsibacter sp.]